LGKENMRTFAILAFLTAVASLMAGPSGDFAKSGRILTIEQWHAPEGTAWAVLDRQIIVYRMFDYVNRKDELVATKAITAAQSKAIRDAIARLPKDAFGYCHTALLSTHAPMLRLGFRGDGALDLHGIEVAGHFPTWIEDVVVLVSTASEPEAPISFRQAIYVYRERLNVGTYSPDIQKIDLRRSYGMPKPWWKFWE
jgi:hypothetical protein